MPQSLAEADLVAPSRLVLDTGRVRIGSFHCSPGHPRFADSGPASGNLVVFPRCPVVITHAGGRPLQADPTRVMLYTRGQEYRRSALCRDGDRSDWFAFRLGDVAEAVLHAAGRVGSDDNPLP